jgi:hypothetical protein
MGNVVLDAVFDDISAVLAVFFGPFFVKLFITLGCMYLFSLVLWASSVEGSLRFGSV